MLLFSVAGYNRNKLMFIHRLPSKLYCFLFFIHLKYVKLFPKIIYIYIYTNLSFIIVQIDFFTIFVIRKEVTESSS